MPSPSSSSGRYPTHTSALVIGGGPAGLVSLKYLSCEAAAEWPSGEEPVLVEQESELGGTFRWRGYENAELVSSKQLTCFSDFRYPLTAPDHPSLPNFVQYLHDYVDHFKIQSRIRLESKVTHLERNEDKNSAYKHKATITHLPSGDVYTIYAQKVVVTTGLHVLPNIPSIEGLTSPSKPSVSNSANISANTTSSTEEKATKSSPEWIHSSSYKSRSQLTGKKVLVLGCGETGMDVAYESVLANADKVWMGIRSGFLSFPKVLNNFRVLGATFDGALPIDGLITNLFETAYVHPWVSASHIRWFISDFVIKRVLWVLTGTQAGCNQWAGELPPERQGRAYVFLNKSAKAMQFINRPYESLSPWHRMIAHYIDPPLPEGIKDPTINVVPFPSRFESDGRVVFPSPPKHRSKETGWKEECRPDLVVLCTGYRQDWSWLGEGYPRGPDECDVRGVCSSKDPSIAFIGFLRPGVGAIPPMAEMQVQLFLLLASGKIPTPTTPETYHLLHSPTSRIQYGVDYSTYMAQLARDMGSAPSLGDLWREYGWFVTFVYCFGAAFPTFYRLVGPYRSSKAREIVETELWDTIKRRGAIGNIFMGVIPMAFYAILNLVAYLLEGTWVLFAPIMGFKMPETGQRSKAD